MAGKPAPTDVGLELQPPLELPRVPVGLRGSRIGRLLWPVLEERRTLAGRLAFMGLGFLVAFILIALLAPVISPYDPTPSEIRAEDVRLPPSPTHWMGTDYLGRDVFSRVLWGARTSLMVMLIGAMVALVVGAPLGLLSGYAGGYADRILVLVMDSMYSFPGLLLAIALAAVIGKGVLNIGIAITVIYVPFYFRVIRNHVVSVKQELFVEAARALGARPTTIIAKYITYNVVSSIPVIFSISAADAILTAAGLSYLGLGIPPEIPDWGLDLSQAQGLGDVSNGIWWTSFFPGLMILILATGLSLLGEGINDIVNPLLRRTKA